MDPEILIRLAMTVAILAGLWIQWPRFTRNLEEKGRLTLKEQRGKKKQSQAEEDAIIQTYVSRGRKILVGTFVGLVVIAWVLPLPF